MSGFTNWVFFSLVPSVVAGAVVALLAIFVFFLIFVAINLIFEWFIS